jgi:cyclohexadienyl dehydratase
MLGRRDIVGAGAVAGGVGAAALLARPAAAQGAAPKSRLQTIQETGKLRAGTTGDFNPMSFRDPATREYRGHQIDCARQCAQDMGVQLDFVATDWRTLISGIVANQYDVVFTGTSMSVARAKAVGFTMPWGKNAFVPLVQKQNAGKFKSWDELNQPSVTVGFNLGTTMEQFVQRDLPRARVRRVESPARDWQELLSGRVDVTVTSLIEGSSLVREHQGLEMMFLDQPRNGIPMSFITAIDDVVLINFLNNWITIRTADGWFRELNAKWQLAGQG